MQTLLSLRWRGLPSRWKLPHLRSSSSTPATPPPPTKRSSLISSYISTLRARYPQADPPSLVASFLLLHELTAIVPLFLGFFGFKYLNLGNGVVDWMLHREPWFPAKDGGPTWLQSSGRRWVAAGEQQAERIGRRYGVLGFDKETKEEREERKKKLALVTGEEQVFEVQAAGVSGDVANLVAAYIAVKLLLPVRLLASARLAPPLANVIVTRFKSLRNMGANYLKKKT